MVDKIIDTSAPNLLIDAARNFPLVTKANTALPDGPCRGLLVSANGYLNLTDIDGNDEDSVFVIQGYNPLVCTKVRPGGDDLVVRVLY